MLKLFGRYVSVGVLNTAIRWLCFGALFSLIGLGQSISNLVAFCVAVTFSFLVNAKWTFKSKATTDFAAKDQSNLWSVCYQDQYQACLLVSKT
ncbi:GtrA family protein [Citrobacter werkmanii]|nr:GtrA family protein [Citrobacter werkmanii]